MNGDEVIGQDGAMARLTQMANNNKLPHALLFTGPEGCGKMAVALAFASYLLCDGSKRINPNLNIANARAMAERMEHPDLHFTFPTIKLPSMGSAHQPISLDFIKEWNSLTEASNTLNISIGNISSVINGKRKQAGGYIWKAD